MWVVNLEALDLPMYKGFVAEQEEQTMVVGGVMFCHYSLYVSGLLILLATDLLKYNYMHMNTLLKKKM
jgi:hypothetical protein